MTPLFTYTWEAAWWTWRYLNKSIDGQTQFLIWSWTCEFCGLTFRIASLIRELLLLIYKSGFKRWESKHPSKDNHDPHSNHIHKLHHSSRVKKVGALASVFERSAAELKQQKLLKCKQTIQIAIFNVRTLNRIGQLPDLTASAVEQKVDIMSVQEHRYTHTKDIKYPKHNNSETQHASHWRRYECSNREKRKQQIPPTQHVK